MWTTRGLVDLYLLVILRLGTPRVWISPCTARPDSAWVSQQSKNFLRVADWQLMPKIVTRDNDASYTAPLNDVLRSGSAKGL
jgi:putative transposase